jgi:triphosphoribosyl-dephospho-CoA synthase
LAEAIADAYRAACLAELQALKPGNVHVFAEGHRMTVADFARSAEASAPAIAMGGARVGARIRGAVEATAVAIGQNTNLGIVLLCAPLAAAAERPGPLRAALAGVLDGLDRADAADAFAAIRLANPGGLGRVPAHDVRDEPAVTLGEAMEAAAARDRIARAYVTAFEDVWITGLPELEKARRRGLDPAWTASAVYLAFLSAVPDTHVARKHGPARAEALRRKARDMLDGLELGPGATAPFLAFDATLKAEGINPGTSADFTVATLFAGALGARSVEGSVALAGAERPR